MVPERRKKKLIEPGLQLRLGLFFFLAAAGSVSVQAIVLRGGLTEIIPALGDDGSLLRQEISSVLLQSSALTLALLIPFTLTMGIRWMFRIVGPLYRFRVYLGEVARGETTAACRIRHTDELHPHLRRINALTAPLRQEEAAPLHGDDTGYEAKLQLKCAAVFASVATAAVLINLIAVNSILEGLTRKLPEAGFALKGLIPDVSLTSFQTTLLLSLPLTIAIGWAATHGVMRELRDFRLHLDAALGGGSPTAERARAGHLNGLFALASEVVELRKRPDEEAVHGEPPVRLSA